MSFWIFTVVVTISHPVFEIPQIVYAVAIVAKDEKDCAEKERQARANFEGATVKTDCDLMTLGKSISKKRGSVT